MILNIVGVQSQDTKLTFRLYFSTNFKKCKKLFIIKKLLEHIM